MRIQHKRGTTAQNNGWTLPRGMISIDSEKNALRIHDGSTPGGFEVIGERAIEWPIRGDLTTGFYGEVGPTELISYSDLSLAVGLSGGTLQHDTESAWLKFSNNGQVTYIAKKVARTSVNWNTAQSLDILYDSEVSRTVTINDITYRVTLMRNSEWGRLIYPVHTQDPDSVGWGINYSDTDLNVEDGAPVSYMIDSPNTDRAIVRGGSTGGVTFYGSWNAAGTGDNRGWRPVLRALV